MLFALKSKTKGSLLATNCSNSHIGGKTNLLSMKVGFLNHSRQGSWSFPNNLMMDPVFMSDDDAIFLEVVGGLNKEVSVYGLGSQCSSFVEISSPGASRSMMSQQISISMLHNFIERELADFGFHNYENVGRRIGKEVESRMSPYESTLLEMQNLLSVLTVNIRVEGSIQVPNFE